MTELTALALNAAHQLSVAELHGVVCGLVVSHPEALPLQDLVELVGADALTDEASVAAFVAQSADELRAEDLSFAPLLPGDDTALPVRLEALGEWCSSFLTGLAAGLARRGTGSLEDLPEDVREIVRDLTAISQVDAEHAGEGEGPETDLVELEEFVKVGVLIILNALAHESDDPAG